MATINIRKVEFTIIWDKDEPTDLTWRVRARAYITDDTEGSGEKLVQATSEPQMITRADFYAEDGSGIETLMINLSTTILQALGSGAGGHTIVNDLG